MVTAYLVTDLQTNTFLQNEHLVELSYTQFRMVTKYVSKLISLWLHFLLVAPLQYCAKSIFSVFFLDTVKLLYTLLICFYEFH